MFNSKILTDNGVNLEKSLELFGDMNTYNETLSDFLSDVENKLADIKKYKEAADMANYAILVHSLKSDARYFGFEMLADMAYNHEMESKANNMYYVYEHYDELMTEAKKILSIVKKYLGVQIGDAEEKEEVIVKDKTVLVYCRSGNRSKMASAKLVELGYTDVRNFGGIIDWPYEIVK